MFRISKSDAARRAKFVDLMLALQKRGVPKAVARNVARWQLNQEPPKPKNYLRCYKAGDNRTRLTLQQLRGPSANRFLLCHDRNREPWEEEDYFNNAFQNKRTGILMDIKEVIEWMDSEHVGPAIIEED